MTCGTYMIKNKKTGQIYIGQSSNIEQRFDLHCRISPIDLAIGNEGVDNFDFIIIEEVSKDKLLERERYWIDFYNAYENEYHYNLSSGCYFSDIFKYDLWDVGCCHYKKGRPDGQKVFSFIYDNYRIPMGMFNDFVSVEIINRLVKEAIKNEIK